MNITPHTPSLPLATVVNPPTEVLRRENHQREIITQVTAAHPSAAEKGVASEKDRARTPAQANEQVDFANLRKQGEHDASSISEQESQQGKSQQEAEQQQPHTKSRSPETAATDENTKQIQADEQIISQLKQRDKEVRTHELAHTTTGGAATGAPSYTFEMGPDGKKYAVGGEVSVDLSSVSGDPQATIVKMQKVHAAALAPASPSSQDIRVAASATQKILAAQSELLAIKSNPSEQSDSASKNLDINSNTTLNEQNDNSDFDTLMNKTLSDQEDIIASSSNQKLASSQNSPTMQSNEVLQRASRIESFYFNVSQGYEKPDNFQFELTA
jgi:hypothetical protein